MIFEKQITDYNDAIQKLLPTVPSIQEITIDLQHIQSQEFVNRRSRKKKDQTVDYQDVMTAVKDATDQCTSSDDYKELQELIESFTAKKMGQKIPDFNAEETPTGLVLPKKGSNKGKSNARKKQGYEASFRKTKRKPSCKETLPNKKRRKESLQEKSSQSTKASNSGKKGSKRGKKTTKEVPNLKTKKVTPKSKIPSPVELADSDPHFELTIAELQELRKNKAAHAARKRTGKTISNKTTS
jgi:hypothetical protein